MELVDFETELEKIWQKLEPLRKATEDEPLIRWQRLTVNSSEVTNLGALICGFSVYKQGVFWKKPIAEIHVAGDFKRHCYRISSWRKRREPIFIFPEDCKGTSIYGYADCAEKPTLEAIFKEMQSILDRIRPLLRDNRIETSYPEGWVGRSPAMIIKEALKNRK